MNTTILSIDLFVFDIHWQTTNLLAIFVNQIPKTKVKCQHHPDSDRWRFTNMGAKSNRPKPRGFDNRESQVPALWAEEASSIEWHFDLLPLSVNFRNFSADKRLWRFWFHVNDTFQVSEHYIPNTVCIFKKFVWLKTLMTRKNERNSCNEFMFFSRTLKSIPLSTECVISEDIQSYFGQMIYHMSEFWPFPLIAYHFSELSFDWVFFFKPDQFNPSPFVLFRFVLWIRKHSCGVFKVRFCLFAYGL